ncbi:hypothetical protein [Thiothrix nivea]|uniref:Uncharacterized protein n=1 Tax=Thiothrix nivea (strain ATCC 35100 / DSM 5205 / JP2) TaxID=870187 RepID=A0A656HGE2_THINJ|nr:hypothetical protein [Thiothrix nivea]EIJ35507.1 hypothetical protein Thini_2981 [Thiothrix nivea DSM 5205]
MQRINVFSLAAVWLLTAQVFADDGVTIAVDHASVSQSQTSTDGAWQEAGIGVVSNLAGAASGYVNVSNVAITQIQANVSGGQQQVVVGGGDYIVGAEIDISVSDVTVIQVQDGLDDGSQLVQVGAVIGGQGNPVHSDAEIAVAGIGVIMQEQTASNHVRQVVRIGVVANKYRP